MRVKRFTGDNVAETMGKIKRELGPEAVILQTRQVKEGGFLGFFARTKVEITAAVEEKVLNQSAASEAIQAPVKPVNSDVIKKAYDAFREKENQAAEEKSFIKDNYVQESGNSSDHLRINTAQSELKEMHNILKEIKGHLTKDERVSEQLPEYYHKWSDFLTSRGVSSALTQELLARTGGGLAEDQWDNDSLVMDRLKKQILSLCTNTETIRPRKSKTMVVALIGPTGVGKTTTIGKLAAGFSIIERRKVALVTADTYRVAAVEQLKTFGEIIGVPVEVVMTPEGLREAIESHWDKELIFIDTAGRSPHHDLHMSELEAFLKEAKPDITMLVMSVTTNTPDQLKVYERFKRFSTHLILTKLDESYSLGSMLDLLANTKLPIAYLTNGQNVPDDIDAATPEKLAGCILGEDNGDV